MPSIMCPPESCCCCKLEVGVKVGAGLFIAYSLLALVLVLAYGDANVDAFCSFEELESTAECGESCAVHESGAWFTADATFYKFSAETVPGFSEDHPEVPIVPLCSSMNQADTTLGTQKTYFVPAPDASSPDDAEGVTAERAGIICSTQRCTEAQVADGSCSSTLATIASAEENERARLACGDSSCWLGLQSARTSVWSDPSEWDDGTAFAYTNWWPVDQPPAREDPSYPKVYVFMNIPGAEPGEHCSALRFHEYFGVFALLVLAGLSTLALMGANALDGKQLDMAWGTSACGRSRSSSPRFKLRRRPTSVPSCHRPGFGAPGWSDNSSSACLWACGGSLANALSRTSARMAAYRTTRTAASYS